MAARVSRVALPMAPFVRTARARIPNFAGVKFTHLDPLDFQAVRREQGDACRLYWGCDEQVVTGLALGAHGAVGSTYNFAMPVYRRLQAAFERGDRDAQDGVARESLVHTVGRVQEHERRERGKLVRALEERARDVRRVFYRVRGKRRRRRVDAGTVRPPTW